MMTTTNSAVLIPNMDLPFGPVQKNPPGRAGRAGGEGRYLARVQQNRACGLTLGAKCAGTQTLDHNSRWRSAARCAAVPAGVATALVVLILGRQSPVFNFGH